jgi:hypothetical protein
VVLVNHALMVVASKRISLALKVILLVNFVGLLTWYQVPFKERLCPLPSFKIQ